MVTRARLAVIAGTGVTIATTSGSGALFDSFVVGGCVTGAAVVILQQHCARIDETGGASCFFAFEGQQHDRRSWPSMLHKNPVRANADDGRSTAKVSRVRTMRRTSGQP